MSAAIDSRTVPDADVPGLSWRVDIEPDDDSKPDDADCYTEPQIAAWRNDEWQYVGVVVTPVIDGMELGSCQASLWGLEYGNYLGRRWIGLDEFIGGYSDENVTYPGYPVPDLISEARGNLAKTLGPVADSLRAVLAAVEAAERLEYLRTQLRAESISYGELSELQSLAGHIVPGDTELLEAAGVLEHPEGEIKRMREMS